MLGAALLATPWVQACEHPLRVVFGHMPPFIARQADGEYGGVEVELLRAIVSQAGCTLEVLNDLPRKRRYAMFLKGDLDILLAASLTEERQRIAWFTAPYRQETTSLFVLADKAAALRDIKSLGELIDKQATLLSLNLGWFGADYETQLPRLRAAHRVSHFENLRQGLSMLAARRGDVLMSDRIATLYEARQRGLNLVELGYTPAREPVHLMLSRKSISEADWRSLNAAVLLLEERGVLREIRNRYGLR
ncbi:transporter substrate-binding domain-containing protein [Paucibacter sp. APW11]|uniref:Transporter substrate-binding domain-containing protein n=1 Tax=Roseateles aquae TaxID=3077235 RepID=A0ABU3PBP2_9BURK|nr:transporter substrate-binding domain-containing protein [Paucibacter sp. APW11]MDT8999974.1 transporter substrate-binding domain-containing protein [Paucibacter sp. APW11]